MNRIEFREQCEEQVQQNKDSRVITLIIRQQTMTKKMLVKTISLSEGEFGCEMGDKEEELVQNKKNLCVTKTNKKVTGWLLLLKCHFSSVYTNTDKLENTQYSM